MSNDRSDGELSLAGRKGAYKQHSLYDVRDTTRAAREARDKKFIDEVDPDRKLPVEERNRRVCAARKAYFADLALRSAQARRARKTDADESATNNGDKQ